MTSDGKRTGQLDAWRSRFRRIATAITTCHHYVKAKVRVHEYPDRTLAVFYRPRDIAVGKSFKHSSRMRQRCKKVRGALNVASVQEDAAEDKRMMTSSKLYGRNSIER